RAHPRGHGAAAPCSGCAPRPACSERLRTLCSSVSNTSIRLWPRTPVGPATLWHGPEVGVRAGLAGRVGPLGQTGLLDLVQGVGDVFSGTVKVTSSPSTLATRPVWLAPAARNLTRRPENRSKCLAVKSGRLDPGDSTSRRYSSGNG